MKAVDKILKILTSVFEWLTGLLLVAMVAVITWLEFSRWILHRPCSWGNEVAVAMLIGNALSVCILQWAVMPALNMALAPWLMPNSEKQRAFSVGGLFLILVLLVGLAFLFRQVTG